MLAAIGSAAVNIYVELPADSEIRFGGLRLGHDSSFCSPHDVVVSLVHLRLLPDWSWTFGLLPSVAGAIYASVYAVNLRALGVTLLLSGLLALLSRFC